MAKWGDCVKDFPVFTTENGVASLVLKEIPYQKTAYVMIRDSREPDKLLAECCEFCRACGAERVFATGHRAAEAYPFHTAIWEMRCAAVSLQDTDAALFPVQEKTLETWREIYNQKVRAVPGGAWMSLQGAREMLEKGDGYFVHRGETLLGIGRASGDTIDWVASLQKGAGKEVVYALAHAVTAETLKLTVASTNKKAVNLYEKLGFVKTGELMRWYQLR